MHHVNLLRPYNSAESSLQYRPKLLSPLPCLFRVNTPRLSLGNAGSGLIFAELKLRSGRKVGAVKLASVKSRSLNAAVEF